MAGPGTQTLFSFRDIEKLDKTVQKHLKELRENQALFDSLAATAPTELRNNDEALFNYCLRKRFWDENPSLKAKLGKTVQFGYMPFPQSDPRFKVYVRNLGLFFKLLPESVETFKAAGGLFISFPEKRMDMLMTLIAKNAVHLKNVVVTGLDLWDTHLAPLKDSHIESLELPVIDLVIANNKDCDFFLNLPPSLKKLDLGHSTINLKKAADGTMVECLTDNERAKIIAHIQASNIEEITGTVIPDWLRNAPSTSLAASDDASPGTKRSLKETLQGEKKRRQDADAADQHGEGLGPEEPTSVDMRKEGPKSMG